MLIMSDGCLFAGGRVRFLDEIPEREKGTAKIYVKIEPGDIGLTILAQVDTGAAWSILTPEVAEEMSLFDEQGVPMHLSTRFGPIDGHLKRTKITILADEGDSVEIEATVFISRMWPAGNFLGYGGLLERVRFAVDPQQNFFYFGRS
jgi:predicted aspartyl protease